MKTITRLLPLLVPYKKSLWASALFNILLALFTLFTIPAFIPFFQILFDANQSIDTTGNSPELLIQIKSFFQKIILQEGKSKALVYVCLFLIIVLFLKNAFRYLALYMLGPLRTGIIRDIRIKIYDKLVRLPLTYFSNERKGDLMSRITNDVMEIEWSVITTIEAFFREPLILLGSLLFMIYVSPTLTGVVLLLMILIGWIIGGASRRLKKQSQNAQDQLGLVNSTIEETIGGMRIIKSFNAENFMSDRFSKENNAYRNFSWAMQKRRDLSAPLSEFLGVTAVVILLYIGSKQVFSQSLAPEVFLTFIFAFYSVIDPSKALSTAWFNLQKASAALDRIDQILLAESEIITKENKKIQPPLFEHAITFKNVSFRYKDQTSEALKNINLTIPKGKTIALVGKSGSGKSTLVDLLPRFYDCTEGVIEIDGVNIKSFDLPSLRSLFSIVTQEAILFHGTIEENIRFGSEANLTEITKAAHTAYVSEYVDHMPQGYHAPIGDRGQKLSGGQRQRLTLARAFLRKAPVLILDEATSALDSQSEKFIQHALDQVLPEMTAIVIAHRLHTIKKADIIVVIDEGEIKQIGTHDELLLVEGAYRHMLEIQS